MQSCAYYIYKIPYNNQLNEMLTTAVKRKSYKAVVKSMKYMTEIYELPQGKIIISFCDENLSIGLLGLNPNQELAKHNRPVEEELVQIYGSCVMKLFDGDKFAKEVTLNEGEELLIPANQFHVHSNPTAKKSITLWKFEGNIVDVVENIRNSFKQIL